MRDMHAAVADSRSGRSQRLRLLDGRLDRAALGPRWAWSIGRGRERSMKNRCPPAAAWRSGWAWSCRWAWASACSGCCWTARRSPAAAAARVHALPEFLVATGIAAHLPGLWQQSAKLWLLLGGGTVLMILGLADDRRGLDWRFRLAAQTAVAATMVACGWCVRLPWDVPGLAFAVSVVWIVGLVNSFNMLDNMDWLVGRRGGDRRGDSGGGRPLAPRPDNHQPQLFVAGFLLLIVGSLLGFLGHNRPPARLFMGDAGSYLIGYLLAMATLTATFAGGGLPPARGLGAAVRDGRADLRYGQRGPHSLAPAAESLRRRQEPLLPSTRQARHDETPGRVDDLSRHRDLRPRGPVAAPGRFDRRDIDPLAGRLHVVAGRRCWKAREERRE